MKFETAALFVLAGIGIYFVYTRVVSPATPTTVTPLIPPTTPTIQPTQTQINSGGPVFPKPGDPLYPVRVTPVPGGPCNIGPSCTPGLPCSAAIMPGRYDANLQCKPVTVGTITDCSNSGAVPLFAGSKVCILPAGSI